MFPIGAHRAGGQGDGWRGWGVSSPTTLWFLLVASLLLLVALATRDNPRFRPAGEDLAATLPLTYWLGGERGSAVGFAPPAAAGTQGEPTAGGLRLAPGDSLRGVVEGPLRSRYFSVEAQIQSRGLVSGDASWKDGRVVLVGIDSHGRRLYDWPGTVCSVEGSQPWRICRETVVLPEGAESFMLVVAHLGKAGELGLAHLGLHRAEPREGQAWVLWGTGLLWVLVGLWVVWRHAHNKVVLGMVLVAAVIVVNAMLPVDQFKLLLGDLRVGMFHASEEIRSSVQGRTVQHGSTVLDVGAGEGAEGAQSITVAELDNWLGINQIQHGGHLVLFALLGGLALLNELLSRARGTRHGYSAIFHAVGWLPLFAAATELSQRATLTRNASWADWLTDLRGLAIGAVLVLLAAWGLRWLQRMRYFLQN